MLRRFTGDSRERNMLERGDVVVYKYHACDNPMDGTVAIVLGPATQDKDAVAIQLLPIQPNPWKNTTWNSTPFFNDKNCQKIGHIDLDAV